MPKTSNTEHRELRFLLSQARLPTVHLGNIASPGGSMPCLRGVACQGMAWRCMPWRAMMSCRVVSCHAMSCHAMSRRVVSCCVVSCRVMSCPVVSCHSLSYLAWSRQSSSSDTARPTPHTCGCSAQAIWMCSTCAFYWLRFPMLGFAKSPFVSLSGRKTILHCVCLLNRFQGPN